jgi:hypothetical protein
MHLFFVCAALLLLHSDAVFPKEWMRGSVIFANKYEDIANPDTIKQLESAKESLGVDWIAAQYMWTQDNATSNAVYVGERTPSTALLQIFVDAAHANNLSVLLKPMVVGVHGELMPTLDPVDPVACGWLVTVR